MAGVGLTGESSSIYWSHKQRRRRHWSHGHGSVNSITDTERTSIYPTLCGDMTYCQPTNEASFPKTALLRGSHVSGSYLQRKHDFMKWVRLTFLVTYRKCNVL